MWPECAHVCACVGGGECYSGSEVRGRAGAPSRGGSAVLYRMRWEAFCEMVTFKQRPEGSEPVALRNRVLDKGSSDAGKQTCSAYSQITKETFATRKSQADVVRHRSRKGNEVRSRLHGPCKTPGGG